MPATGPKADRAVPGAGMYRAAVVHGFCTPLPFQTTLAVRRGVNQARPCPPPLSNHGGVVREPARLTLPDDQTRLRATEART
jgi:hypothetical protein